MYEWEDEEKQRLNEFFKCLSEQDEESRAWKEYTDQVVLFVIDQFSEYLKKRCKWPVVFQPCGSSAEDFKCYFPDDVGDLDLVILPGSEDLEIHEEAIEYLSDSSLYVRINGVGHPLLRSCLVENTNYVATSVLKKFHSAVYGGFSSVFDFIPQGIEAISRPEIQAKLGEQFFARMKQKRTGSALTLDFANSHAPMHEQLQNVKESDAVSMKASNWEWLAHVLCQMKGADYSRGHAEVLEEYMQHCEESFHQFLKDNPSGILQGFPNFVQEICCGGKATELKTRVQDIERRSENESGSTSRANIWPDDGANGSDDLCVTPGEQHPNQENDAKPMQSTPVNDVLEGLSSLFLTENVKFKQVIPSKGGLNGDKNAHDREEPNSQPRLQNEILMLPSTQGTPFEESQSSQGVFSLQFPGQGELKSPVVDKRRDGGKNLGESDESALKVKETSLVEVQRDLNLELPFCDEGKRGEREARIFNRIFRHAAGIQNSESAEEENNFYTEESKSSFRRVGGVDFVPAFKARGWPKVAQEWIQRKRTWPSPETVEKIVRGGFHIAAKAPKIGGNSDRDFKLSFSNAEYILSREVNDVQRDCYRCLKKYYHAYLRTEPKSLVTYHLKHVLFKVCEETDVAIWTEGNRAYCTMLLFRELHDALAIKWLSHYFVATSNMFDENYIENCDILESLAVKVDEIMQNPMKISRTMSEEKQTETEHIVERGQSSIDIDGVPGRDVQLNGTSFPGRTVEETCRGSENDQGCISTENGVSKAEVAGTSHATTDRKMPSEGNRFHDLKDAFMEICHEVVTMAMDGSEIVGNPDPVERSVVTDIKDLATKHGISVDAFRTILSYSWNAVYIKVLLNTEPDVRRRMLVAIQGILEMCKWCLRQPDFGAGNEEAMADRLLDAASAEPFDLSHLLPSGCGVDLLALALNSTEPPSSHVQEVIKGDIPLD